MITCSNLGRNGNTGNSMFQFAALIGISKKTGFNYFIPKHESYFDVNYNCMNFSIFEGFDINCNTTIKTKLNNIYEEPYFHYNPDILAIENFTDINGYFQSEKYFEHSKKEVYEQLQFKSEIKQSIDREIKEGKYSDPGYTTSIHIRRGDYCQKQEYHPFQKLSYYKEACKLANNKKYIFFSDDIEWCKKTFGNDDRLEYSQEDNPFKAMYHMSLCSKHIICNSTFGWWGAWLGEMAFPDKERIIVAPNLWFGPAHAKYNSKDIIPERWIKI
jgi:hypothetical protein